MCTRRVSPIVRAVAVTALMLGGARTAAAQTRLQYAAKVVCGTHDSANAPGLVPRQLYATTINVHNPGRQSVTFTKRLALSIPPGFQRPGRVSSRVTDRLGGGEALAVDRVDLRQRFGGLGLPLFFEGFVVLESPRSLDVVGVYAVPNGISVVQVPERQGG